MSESRGGSMQNSRYSQERVHIGARLAPDAGATELGDGVGPGAGPGLRGVRDLAVDQGSAERKQHAEPPRVSRRLQLLRDWGHETGKEVLPGGAGAGGSAGVRARA